MKYSELFTEPVLWSTRWRWTCCMNHQCGWPRQPCVCYVHVHVMFMLMIWGDFFLDPYAANPWSNCSAPCDGGMRIRIRDDMNAMVRIPCNLQPCGTGNISANECFSFMHNTMDGTDNESHSRWANHVLFIVLIIRHLSLAMGMYKDFHELTSSSLVISY